jgi:serine/threonine protein phosphatase PrpC
MNIIQALIALHILFATAAVTTVASVIDGHEIPDFGQLASLDSELKNYTYEKGASDQYRSEEDDNRTVHFVVSGKGYVFMFVLDGHGAPRWNDFVPFVKANLPRLVLAFLQEGKTPEEAIEMAHSSLQAYAVKNRIRDYGVCTAGSLIYFEGEKCFATCFNTGDTSVILVKSDRSTTTISTPHKYGGDPNETSRLEELQKNGNVVIGDHGRLRNSGMPEWEGIMVSNAIGDVKFPFISWKPHICTVEIPEEGRLIALTDGVTDYLPLDKIAKLACHNGDLLDSALNHAIHVHHLTSKHIDDMSYVQFDYLSFMSEEVAKGNQNPFVF